MSNNNILNFAKLGKMIINDLNDVQSNTSSSSIMKRFNKDNIIKFMSNPQKNEKQLREVSRYLYNASPNYKRLILYFAYLPTFDYIVEPYGLNPAKVNIDAFKKQYQKNLDTLESMNLSHEFLKVLKVAFKEDVFYGYEHTEDDSYFIQPMNPEYCKISSIEDGVYNYAYDFSYFDKNYNKIDTFPQEFKVKYAQYKKTSKKWIELDSKNTICIKINEELEYPVPPFNTVFESIFDIEDYKRLKKAKTKLDNYMILTHEIPVNDKSGKPDDFLIDLDTAITFHNRAAQALPEEVGLITSPMKMSAIKLDKNSKDADNVAHAERDYYNAAGVSQVLFNSDKTTSVGLNKSVVTDEQVIFAVLRQLERWVNRKIKRLNKTYNFKVKFLDITVFNRNEVSDRLLKAAQFGMPVKMALGASLGLTPSSFSSMSFLENEVLSLHDKLRPLQSSHTQTTDEGGAPTKEDDNITESGQQTRDNGSNVES
ncbi:hypothetical protein [Priestia megaterium]|uniref:hypothetical protein n=1 Tax=Priestia megaterium TaxID=1404 RepID=UPI003CC6BD4B